MSARQLIVLVIAAIAAIGALLLIRGMAGRPAQHEAAASPVVGERVLVAARDIGQGAALTPSDLAVAAFPNDAVTPAFVRIGAQPSAQTEFVGAVTLRAFAQGEPIMVGSVVQPDGRGFLAAQLAPGHRAVAVKIEREDAAGGYIQPNDHVDVILTTADESGPQKQYNSQIVLRDVRVLALGDKTTPQTSGEAPQVIEADVAVLELSAEDARVLALADEMGDIRLALRGVQAETVGMGAGNASMQQGGSLRIHAFGSVTGGGR